MEWLVLRPSRKSSAIVERKGNNLNRWMQMIGHFNGETHWVPQISPYFKWNNILSKWHLIPKVALNCGREMEFIHSTKAHKYFSSSPSVLHSSSSTPGQATTHPCIHITSRLPVSYSVLMSTIWQNTDGRKGWWRGNCVTQLKWRMLKDAVKPCEWYVVK